MKTAFLTLASILLALLLCEAALRLINRNNARTPPRTAAPDKSGIAEAARYIAAMPFAPGTDRAWFTEDPPPLPNRTAPDSARLARYQEFERRGLYLTEADYLWNRNFVESALCDPKGLFQKFPGDIPVFD